jgi:hypothetical protein
MDKKIIGITMFIFVIIIGAIIGFSYYLATSPEPVEKESDTESDTDTNDDNQDNSSSTPDSDNTPDNSNSTTVVPTDAPPALQQTPEEIKIRLNSGVFEDGTGKVKLYATHVLPKNGKITKVVVHGHANGASGKPMLVIQKSGSTMTSYTPESEDDVNVKMAFEFKHFENAPNNAESLSKYNDEHTSVANVVQGDILTLGIFASPSQNIMVGDLTMTITFIPSHTEGYPKTQKQYESSNNKHHLENIKYFHTEPLGINDSRLSREYYTAF